MDLCHRAPVSATPGLGPDPSRPPRPTRRRSGLEKPFPTEHEAFSDPQIERMARFPIHPARGGSRLPGSFSLSPEVGEKTRSPVSAPGPPGSPEAEGRRPAPVTACRSVSEGARWLCPEKKGKMSHLVLRSPIRHHH